jgi:hypothetical protein
MSQRSTADEWGDVPAEGLDESDDAQREELRQRYYGLLQELRVLLPGVQVFVAFLLTAPFAARFGELDDVERFAFGLALWSGLVAVISFVTPTVFHRVGGRTLRAQRLAWGIRTTRAGLAFLALSLLSASLVITRFVYDETIAWLFVGSIALAMTSAWVLIPLESSRRRYARSSGTAPDPADGRDD